MPLNQVLRSFALIGIIAAIVHVGSITYPCINPETNVTNIINAFVSSLIFIGLICSYLAQTKDLGLFGIISFIVLYIGFILVCGLEWMNAFTRHVMESLSPSLNFDNLPSPLIEGMAVSFLTFNLGILLFGISILKSSIVSRWPVFYLLWQLPPTLPRQWMIRLGISSMFPPSGFVPYKL